MLGHTLDKIAFEKAGIMKPGIPCLIGEYDEVSYTVFKQHAAETKVPLFCASKSYKTKKSGENTYLFRKVIQQTPDLIIHSSLSGSYQEKNINTVLAAVQLLNQNPQISIPISKIQSGFDRLDQNAPLIGRWQWISKKPPILADAAHNVAGISALFKEIKKSVHGTLHCVFGTVKDKDTEPVLALLPVSARYYFVAANLPRAMPAEMLCEKARHFNLIGTAYKKVSIGLQAAKKAAQPGDLILVTGSIFVVSEVI
jgi:dihydrofolate synthase/folylpolyglutamate synthase